MADGIKKINENVIKPGRALTLTGTSVADYEGIPAGSLRTKATTKGLEYKISNNNWSKFNGEGLLNAGTITTNLLANKCVTNAKIADSAVDTRTLKDSSVTTAKITNLNVTTEKLANLSITTGKIANKAVTEPKIADSAVITRCIKDAQVTTPKIADRAVTEAKIAANAVTNYQIAGNAVHERNILNSSVTFNKIANGAVYGAKIPNEGIDHLHIRKNAVTTVKIADGAVTGGVMLGVANGGTGKIAAQTITSYNIKNGGIGTESLAAGCVDKDILASLSVNTGHIVNGAVTKDKLHSSVQSVITNAVVHDTKGHAKVISSMSIGANAKSGYALSVDGDIIANRVYNSVYMDIAEGYTPGEDLEPGDIVCIREDGKVYKADVFSRCVVGVISDQYASCYGATPEELKNKTKVAVGLIGKVPVKIKGPATIGQYIGSSNVSGVGITSTSRRRSVGKVLETVKAHEDEISEVLCLIFPN